MIRKIVILKTDGSPAGVFDSISMFAKTYHHSNYRISKALKQNILFRNMKIMYWDEYEAYLLNHETDKLAYVLPDGKKYGDRKQQQFSEEGLRRRKEASSKLANRLKDEGRLGLGRRHNNNDHFKKPIMLVKNHIDIIAFPSMVMAGKYLKCLPDNIPRNIKKGYKTRGYNIRYITKEYYNRWCIKQANKNAYHSNK